jgi:hypothetical protein
MLWTLIAVQAQGLAMNFNAPLNLIPEPPSIVMRATSGDAVPACSGCSVSGVFVEGAPVAVCSLSHQ